MTMSVSRRSLLALSAGFSASAIFGDSALAKEPKLGTQSPYFHRMKVGDAEVTVVSDGPLPLGPPKGTFTGASDDEIRKMLVDNFLSPDNIVLEQNSPVVNTGDKLILFDTGMGTAKNFGPTTGRSQKSMKEAGISPADIDAVVFTHAHIDHIGGVVDESGKVLFPNAQFYIAETFAREPDQAIPEFARVVEQYPTSARAPAALMRIGALELARGNRTEARARFNQVVRAYPRAPEAEEARSELARLGRG